jgi:hypothetical protein
MEHKHDFKCISQASGGWQSKNAIVQCTICKKVFVFDAMDDTLQEVEIVEKE